MMGIARGTAMWMTQTKSVPILDDNYIWLFGGGNLGPVPVLVIWTLAIAVDRPYRAAPHHLRPPRAGDRRQRDRGALQRRRHAARSRCAC